MKHQRVELLKLAASEQPRPLITADVDKLANSIREVGLIQPITVKSRAVMSGGLSTQGFQIVAGHHRVAACRSLGWTEIDAIVIESVGHLEAELVEIDENLCRSELTASQRSHYTKRRRDIWAALHPVEREESRFAVAQVAPAQFESPMARPQEKAFAASTAAVTGESKSQVNRHLARANAIGDDLPRIQGTSLDKGVELDALAKLPQPERAALIERAESGEKVSARKPAPAVEPEHEAPPEYTELDAAHDLVSELQAELVVARMGNATEEERQQAAGLIAELRAEVKALSATLAAVELSRDSLMEERAQMLRQMKAQRAEIDRLKPKK